LGPKMVKIKMKFHSGTCRWIMRSKLICHLIQFDHFLLHIAYI